MNYFEPTKMHTVYLILIYTVLFLTCFGVYHTNLQGGLQYSLLKTISIDDSFVKTDGFE
jgi:hypothetical protein